MRLAVTGATGRMGGAVLAAAADRDAAVVLAVAREATTVADRDVVPDDDLADRLRDAEVDVLVDFSAPAATERYAEACAESGVSLVGGTTGLGDDARGALAAAAERVPVLHATNFARGVAALERLLADAADALPGYDLELVETHHAGKRDAPSGTAGALLDAAGVAEDDRVHGREGEAPRAEGEVGVHAVRAGAVAGEHEAILAGDGEELRLTHRAGDRRVFAAGALDAAAWLAGRDPGRYAFHEVIES
jgi:4-hydroxy-tetrahydrodipicolinate reductase